MSFCIQFLIQNNLPVAAMKEKWDKKKNDNKDGDEKKEPKCNFLPSAMSMCFISNVVRVSLIHMNLISKL